MKQGDLFALLPDIHRVRDLEHGNVLAALMRTLESGGLALDANIGLMYDSWFIETCPDWTVPYIADLLGIDPALSAGGLPQLRCYVANKVRYERARGITAVVGQAASAVTGWPVLAVDLGLRVVRSHDGRAGRGGAGTLRLDGPGLSQGEAAVAGLSGTPRLTGRGDRAGKAGRAPGPLPSAIALLAWRLPSRFLRAVEPARLGAGRFTLNPFGVDMPLFTAPARLPVSGPAASPDDMPQPLTRTMLAALLAQGAPSPLTVRVLRDGVWQEPPRLVAADLSAWPAAPRSGLALIDPELGRLAIGDEVEAVAVDHAIGGGAIGGGPYNRADRLVSAGPGTWAARVCAGAAGDVMPANSSWPLFASLGAALAACPEGASEILIEIADNGLHRLDEGGPAILFCAGRHLVIQAMDGFRPSVSGGLSIVAESEGRVTLSGLWWRGRLGARGPVRLEILDSTIWPDHGPAIAMDPAPPRAAPVSSAGSSLLLDGAVAGPITAAGSLAGLDIRRSIVDGRGGNAIQGLDGEDRFAPPPSLDRATLLGGVLAMSAPVDADSLITGAVLLPRGHARAPSGALFRSRRFGDPAYGMLAEGCPPAVASGAADGDELGAFHGGATRARLEALSRVVDSYLPEGLSGILYFMS